MPGGSSGDVDRDVPRALTAVDSRPGRTVAADFRFVNLDTEGTLLVQANKI